MRREKVYNWSRSAAIAAAAVGAVAAAATANLRANDDDKRWRPDERQQKRQRL